MPFRIACLLLCVLLPAMPLHATEPLPQLRAYEAEESWRQPVPPVRIADHTWQIGTAGITSLLIRTDAGAVLIDGGLPQAADLLLANMRALGVAPGELKLILHSHAHVDHVGSLAAIKRATGATVVSNAESAWLLAHGGSDDLQFGEGLLYAPVQVDRLVHDGETISLGGLRLTVHFTPGHTPGSMSWTWVDSLDGKSMHIAYVDSLSIPGYRLLDNPRYPRIVDDLRHSFAVVRALPCDLMLSPHATRDSGWDYADAAHPHTRQVSCRQYADRAEHVLDEAIARERRAEH